MKTEKKKSKESLIGKIIYGFLLFMPLLSVLVTCLYVIQNDNAHESYYGETINNEQVIDVNTLNSLKENESYLFTISNTTLNTNNSISNMIFVTNVRNVVGTTNLQNTFSFTTYQYQTTKHLYIKNSDNTTNDIVLSGPISFEFDYLYNTISDETAFQSHFANSLRLYQYNKYTYLDDAFMYGLYKTEESQYFNWSKNTALYTGVKEFTNTLGITTTYIPFLMTYWLLISVVYLIYDIALMMLHMAHNKIHQLEGSI